MKNRLGIKRERNDDESSFEFSEEEIGVVTDNYMQGGYQPPVKNNGY